MSDECVVYCVQQEGRDHACEFVLLKLHVFQVPISEGVLKYHYVVMSHNNRYVRMRALTRRLMCASELNNS